MSTEEEKAEVAALVAAALAEERQEAQAELDALRAEVKLLREKYDAVRNLEPWKAMAAKVPAADEQAAKTLARCHHLNKIESKIEDILWPIETEIGCEHTELDECVKAVVNHLGGLLQEARLLLAEAAALDERGFQELGARIEAFLIHTENGAVK